MSVLLMVAVRDNAVQAFAAPFCVRSKGEAIRSFSQAAMDDKLPFKASPKDYSLFLLGAFDDQSGALSSVTPERLIGADEVEGGR